MTTNLVVIIFGCPEGTEIMTTKLVVISSIIVTEVFLLVRIRGKMLVINTDIPAFFPDNFPPKL